MENKKIRLAYLAGRYPAVFHSFILREIRFLRAEGLEIHAVSLDNPDRPFDALTPEEQVESRKTYYVKQEGFFKTLKAIGLTLLYYPRGFFKGLGEALLLGRADLKKLIQNLTHYLDALLLGQWMINHALRHVHVHFASPASTVAMLVSRIFSTGFSITCHGPDEFYNVNENYLTEKIEASAFMICVGYYTKSQLMRISRPAMWSKFEICPLGVDPNVFLPRSPRLSPSPFEILCVGRLVPSKGQHILIEALEILIKAGYNVRLRLIGDGTDRKSLEEEVDKKNLRDQVIFSGALNMPLVMEAYRKTDIFALASFAEGVPVVLMEAMSMEIPCVATHISGIPELIRPGKDGLLVVPADPIRLSKALRNLLDDPELRTRLGKAGRQRVLDQFRLDVNTKSLAGLFAGRLGIHHTPKEK